MLRASEEDTLLLECHMTSLGNLLKFHYMKRFSILNRFVLSTLGFTTITFSVGALQLLTPSVLTYATLARGDKATESTLYFGVCICFCGIIGTAIGSYMGTHWKLTNPSGDALGGSIKRIAMVTRGKLSKGKSCWQTPVVTLKMT